MGSPAPGLPLTTGKTHTIKLVPTFTKEELAAGDTELKLVQKWFGTLLNAKGAVAYAKGSAYKVDLYLTDRNAFFGSSADYEAYLNTSRTELDADAKSLRSKIEPPVKARARAADWEQAQDVFYAWVRKAYEKELGTPADIQAILKAGMSAALRTKLAQVKLDFGKKFHAGGFNPRPMKKGGCRLGTLSDHALGNAIDINDKTNAQIPTATWDQLCKLAGLTLDTKARKSQWSSAPASLHADIKQVNDTFVAEVARLTAAQQKTDPAMSDDAARAAAVKSDPSLKAIGLTFIKQWHSGFFDLPWELVDELHQEGFVWGATFTTPDLHHFEL